MPPRSEGSISQDYKETLKYDRLLNGFLFLLLIISNSIEAVYFTMSLIGFWCEYILRVGRSSAKNSLQSNHTIHSICFLFMLSDLQAMHFPTDDQILNFNRKANLAFLLLFKILFQEPIINKVIQSITHEDEQVFQDFISANSSLFKGLKIAQRVLHSMWYGDCFILLSLATGLPSHDFAASMFLPLLIVEFFPNSLLRINEEVLLPFSPSN